MNKNILLGFLALVIVVLVAMLFRTTPSPTNSNGSVVLSSSGVNSSTNSGDVMSTASGVAEKVYFVHNNDPVVFNEAVLSGFVNVGKQYNQELVPVLENDPRVKNIVDKAYASGAMYYPMFVMSQNTQNINFDQVPADQSFVDSEAKTFALLEPLMGNLPKIVIKRNEVVDTLLAKYVADLKNVTENDEYTVLLVEDPMCPYCAQAFLKEDEEKKYSTLATQVLYFPLPIQGHENANKLLGILRANKGNQDEILRVIFKNQDAFSTLAETEVFNKLKALLKTSGSKITLKDGTGYTDEEKFEVQTLLIKLGVTGTPSTFVITKDNLILIGDTDMIGAITAK